MVIGAGIAGLAAATTLQAAGCEVVVVDPSDRPGGVMRISLYSQKARSNIRAAHSFIRQAKLEATPEGIRKFRQRVLNDGKQGELGELLDSADFYNISGCRDLVFHQHEQQFTLARLGRALASLNLKLIGLDLPSPEIIQAFFAMFSSSASVLDLNLWEQFEEKHPNTFVGMYQFWCQKIPQGKG